MNKKQLKALQFRILMELEKDLPKNERKELLAKLDYLEALGDKQKGLLQPEQKLILFTPAEYLQRSKTETDKEIYEELQISRRTFYLWKKKNQLLDWQKAEQSRENYLAPFSVYSPVKNEKVILGRVAEPENEYISVVLGESK